MTKFKVRQANIDDVDVITQFNSLMGLETEGINIDANTLLEGVKAILIDPTKGLYFVAETDEKVVGQLMITYEWSDWRNANFWWIQSVYVLPEFRRKGIFKTLFQYVYNLALEDKNVCGLRLYVEKDNATAKETYKILGLFPSHYDMFEVEFKK